MSEARSAGAAIRTPDQRLRVFISSTLEELGPERRAVQRAVSALGLTPVMFELGARPHPPRELYRAYLAQSDVFIGLYWQRYGWIGPDMTISGLEDEFESAGGLPRLLYMKTPAPEREPRLADLLRRVARQASYRNFSTRQELGRLVRDDLALLLSERFGAGRSPPRRGRAGRLPPLPAGTTSLIGRDAAIGEVVELLADPVVRWVTLTGPGGVGKTRLALAVGARARDRYDCGMAFVPLAAVSDPGLVLPSIARVVGTDLAGTGSPAQALAERFSDEAWLLLLDNLEQLAGAARDVDELLLGSPGLTVLATSRTALRLRAEREYPVPPLPLPDSAGTAPAEIAESPAVALFVDRARAVRPDFALTAANAPAVAAICRRLEGLPLAIELAAARIRLLDPVALEARLGRSLDALGTGAVDMPTRQQTLRATVEWSVGLLADAERSLLEVCAVFVGGWTVEAAAEVAALDEDRALELLEALDRHSLMQREGHGDEIRCRMLETVREFVAERLAARPDVAEIRRRHAGHYRTMAERAGLPLRRGRQDEEAMRLASEAGNLAAAVRWYLAEDRAPLPDMFAALLPLWAVNDDFVDEVRGWVDQLLPTADELDPHDRTEVLVTDVVIAREVADDATGRVARDRLGVMLGIIDDPFLHAVAELAVGTTSAIIGDWDRALGAEKSALAELRRMDEPFWTTLALIALGIMEMALGRYDDASTLLHEMRDLSARSGNARFNASAHLNLGRLAILRNRPDEAAPLLARGLEMSRALRMTRNVSLALTAFALLTAERDPERAARLAGAAEGVRSRAGLRVWPMPPQESELLARLRRSLGADRYDELFEAGTRLSQREAVAQVPQTASSSSDALGSVPSWTTTER